MPVGNLLSPVVSSRTLGYVFLWAIGFGAYATLAVAEDYYIGSEILNTPSQFHAVLSLVLGWLLVFRTNTAYNRWWEARILWGNLVNASRNLAIKIVQLTELAPGEATQIQQTIANFALALKFHLRGEPSTLLPVDAPPGVGEAKHIPQELARKLYAWLGQARREGRVAGDELRAIDRELSRLMDITGGCERILKTRIVKSYRIFARQCVGVFLATLPWGIVHDFRMWTVPLTILTAYFMIGLETVAEHVEEPFGYDDDDLDLDALCATIHDSVVEIFLCSDRPLAADQ
ncbi:MAG: hypothetical protein D6753_18720 [Planctomycetota bacterium]|nr:MAG: hypothetical protein D6753_18720 [Planctomycetota bacterium]